MCLGVKKYFQVCLGKKKKVGNHCSRRWCVIAPSVHRLSLPFWPPAEPLYQVGSEHFMVEAESSKSEQRGLYRGLDITWWVKWEEKDLVLNKPFMFPFASESLLVHSSMLCFYRHAMYTVAFSTVSLSLVWSIFSIRLVIPPNSGRICPTPKPSLQMLHGLRPEWMVIRLGVCFQSGAWQPASQLHHLISVWQYTKHI